MIGEQVGGTRDKLLLVLGQGDKEVDLEGVYQTNDGSFKSPLGDVVGEGVLVHISTFLSLPLGGLFY
jgi:hypothetical protein